MKDRRMKPPQCAICKKNFRKNSDTVFKLFRFKMTEKQEKEKMKQSLERKIGHPENAVWFCEEHYEEARKHSQLTAIEYFEYRKSM